MHLPHSKLSLLPISLALSCACAGCLSPPRSVTGASTDTALSSAYTPPAAAATPSVSSAAAPADFGALDQKSRDSLTDNLSKIDPTLQQQYTEAYRASLAYREETARKAQALAEAQAAAKSNYAATTPTTYPSTSAPAATLPPSAMRQVGYSDPPPPGATIPPWRTIQTAAQSLPESPDGPLMPRANITDVTNHYPDTLLPPVQLVASDNARPMNGADRSANGKSIVSDWHDPLSTAISGLETKVAGSAGQPTTQADEARLRLLYLAAGRKDEATTPLPGATPDEQEFWNQELSGLAPFTDDQHSPDEQKRNEEAARHLHAAATELEQNAPLDLRHLAFCTEVNSFGVYKPFPEYDFKRGQEVLLYAEVENFTSTTTEKGYHTALHASVQILNSRGDRVATQNFALTEEYCRNLRHDFFVRYFLNIPKNIATGQYTLQLTLEDTQGNKTGQANIPFAVTE